MLLLLGTALLGLSIYFYVWKPMQYWKRRDVPYLTPVPILGNMWRSFFGMNSFSDESIRIYNVMKEKQYGGLYFFNIPVLSVMDPELLRRIGVKDFDHFLDHTEQFLKKELDPVLSQNLFSLTGKKWKDMRSTLSPIFTGSKMKLMFGFISECGDQLALYLSKETKTCTEKPLDVELKELCTRFTNDVIASTVFGIKINSLEEKTNEFYMNGHTLTDLKVWRLVGVNVAPTIMKWFKQGAIPNAIANFFSRIVLENIEHRERNKIVRPDVIHLLLEARKGKLHYDTSKNTEETGFAIVEESTVGRNKVNNVISDEDIVAQAFIFFFAGFDTVSTCMSFTVYELALNPDIQKRLQEEIDEVLENYNGKVTYEGVNKMKYLDMVISESLRKWPPAPVTDRFCTKTYTTELDGKKLTIEKGTTVNIPILGIHRNPEYYENPEVFDPERFNDDNKHRINQFTYMPFGIGPRNCIGSRFALMETKILLIHLLKSFDVSVTEKTPIPFRYKRGTSANTAENGFWVGIKPRC